MVHHRLVFIQLLHLVYVLAIGKMTVLDYVLYVQTDLRVRPAQIVIRDTRDRIVLLIRARMEQRIRKIER